MIYLAAPYSHPDKAVIEERMRVFYKIVAELTNNGDVTVSPLMNHPIVQLHNVQGDWVFWEKYSKTLLSRCDRMIVIMLDGWEKSPGVTGEIKFCIENNIPYEYMEV